MAVTFSKRYGKQMSRKEYHNRCGIVRKCHKCVGYFQYIIPNLPRIPSCIFSSKIRENHYKEYNPLLHGDI